MSGDLIALVASGVVATLAAPGMPVGGHAGAQDTVRPARAGAPAQELREPFTRFDRVVREELARSNVPGAAVAIVRGDTIVFARGFGVASVETRAPVTPDMLFQAGSASKMFTAALVTTLSTEGALDLGAPVGRYVDGLAPAVTRLTTHGLLSHTSGLTDRSGADGRQDESALAEYPRSWTDAQVILPPGTVFSYSNHGFALAGLAAQRVTGKPFADLVRDRVFAPLGMDRSTYRPLDALTYPAAAGHRLSPGAPPRAELRVARPYANDTRLWPAGYAWTSARDLARYLIAVMNGGRIDGRQILPSAAIASFTARHVTVPSIFTNTSYGYGVFIGPYRGLESIWHDGQMPGFGAVVRMLPARRLGVVVLLNRENVRADRIVDAAFDALDFRAPAEPAPGSKPELPMTSEEMAAYAGRYVNRFAIDIFTRDGLLYRRWGDQEQRVYKIGEHRFTVDSSRTNPGLEFSIVPAEPGRPAYLHAGLWANVR